MMKSLYQQQFAMMVGVMLLSFSLLSTAFMFLSYRYVIGEKRDALERNAGDIAGFTAEEMAQKTGTTVAQYRSYERGESDFPFSFLHGFHDELCCAGGFFIHSKACAEAVPQCSN